MIKSILILLIAYCLYTPKACKLNIDEQITALRVRDGYHLQEEDSVLVFKGNKYLVVVKEIFDDNGSIIQASIAGDLGYSIYTQREFMKFLNFINDYGLTKDINVSLVDDNHIVFNNRKIRIIEVNKIKRSVYFNRRSTDTIYRLTYR